MSIKETLREFGEYYSKSAKAERQINSQYQDILRVSALPYCGLRHVYTRMIQPIDYTSMGQSYYTTVGTIAHYLVQHSLGYNRRIFGNWVCRQDGCKGRRTFSNNNKCPACKNVMEYKEISLFFKDLYPNIRSVHIDGIYRDSKGRFFIIDYKTTNSITALLPDDKTYLPYLSNVAQIKAYSALIELRYNIEISGWILHYIARDNPIKVFKSIGELITTEEKQKILKKLKVADNQYSLVMAATSFETIDYLVKNKPCKTVEQYNSEYKKYCGCPLASICFDKKMRDRELQRAWADREDDFLAWRRPTYLALPKL